MDTVTIPGGRDARGTLDSDGDADAVVVACPPHPQQRGSRSDARLRAVSDALPDHIDCLRFDYGPWDEGRGERRDAGNALDWARERYDRVGLFGYSFGAGVGLWAAADADPQPDAVSALAPAADAADAIDELDGPVQVVYGERDDTVDWSPVVDRAREHGFAVEAVAGDHHFVGQTDDVAALAADFLADHL